MSKDLVQKCSCLEIRTLMRLKGFIKSWKVEPLKEFYTTSFFKFLEPLSGPGQSEERREGGHSHFSFPPLKSGPGP